MRILPAIHLSAFALLAAVHCGGTTSTSPGTGSGTGSGTGTGNGSGSGSTETVCSGGSVDEETDPKNCGGCGVICDGTCALGRCLVTLASGELNPTAIAVDTTNVYWTDDPSQNGSVMQLPLAGGTEKTTASGQAGPQALAVEGASVYWANFNGDTVLEAPVGGGTATTLLSDTAYMPLSLVANATNIAWTTQGTTGNGDGTVMTLPLAGGTATTLASGQQDILALAMDATHVYWKNGPSILAVPLAGGATTTLCTLSAATSGGSFGMAVDATNVYWTGRDGSAGTLIKVPVAGGTPTTLTSEPSTLSVIAIDSATVYYPGAGGIMSVPISGGAPTTLAAGHGAYGIAVDATSVYWTEYATMSGGTLPGSSEPGNVMKLTPR